MKLSHQQTKSREKNKNKIHHRQNINISKTIETTGPVFGVTDNTLGMDVVKLLWLMRYFIVLFFCIVRLVLGYVASAGTI